MEQDWKTVTLTKTIHVPKKEFVAKPKLETNFEDIEVPLEVTTDLKMAIQKARLNNKLSQKDFAKLLCVQFNVVQSYENGTAIPSNLFISKMEQVLKTKLPRVKKIKS